MSQLYYTLNKDLKQTDLKKSEKVYIIQHIQNLDQTAIKALGDLIYEHYKCNTEDPLDDIIPYEGEYLPEENETVFNLAKFPISLRQVIFKFIKIIQNQQN